MITRRVNHIATALTLLIFFASAHASATGFDGNRALDLVRKQTQLGPRVPGTPPHAACRQWIVGELKNLKLQVTEQSFEVRLPINGQKVQATNIWATAKQDGPSSPALLLSAHWDTRPWADRDPSGRQPLLDGANDGGSGVAVALEILRVLGDDPMRDRIAIAFWDVEDAGVQDDLRSWALGSRHGAQNPPEWIDRVVLGINLDMVGGHDLNLRREYYSMQSAPKAVESIWRIGQILAPDRFSQEEPIQLVDDHLPWIEVQKLPYVDLVGYPYEHWHTAKDTAGNVSPAAMQAVGEVVLQYIRRESWKSEGR